MFEVMNSGSWHNLYPGETRVQLDLTGLVSFYDTDLVPSLVSARCGQERWDHRLQDISVDDVSRVTTRLEEILTRPADHIFSGIDWMALMRVIVDRYSERLEFVRYLINSANTTNSDSLLDCAYKTQLQLRVMLRPYILTSITLSSLSAPEGSRTASMDWARPVFKLCATTHVHNLDTKVMTDSERLLLNAVRETTQEICRVATRMWASGVLAGVDKNFGLNDSALDNKEIEALISKWRQYLDGLMQWLDWNTWAKCRPTCGAEVRLCHCFAHRDQLSMNHGFGICHQEICHLTTWPIGFPIPDLPPPLMVSPGSVPPPEIPPPQDLPPVEITDDWERPQPRCVQRIEPYFGM